MNENENNRIRESLEQIEPAEDAKERMLANIQRKAAEQTSENASESPRKSSSQGRILRILRWAVPAAACLIILFIGAAHFFPNKATPSTAGTITVTTTGTVTTPTGTANVTPTETANVTPTATVTPEESIVSAGPMPTFAASEDLTASSSGAPAKTKEMDDAMRTAYETFAYKLFAQLPEGESRKMISPFSIYVALSMLADGADGDTLAQLDELLGLTAEERNAYLAGWLQKLEGNPSLASADSVWINEILKSNVPKDFLDTCAQYYKSEVYSTPMDDSTIEDVNAWAKAKTRDMIDKLIEELNENTATILMNAIAFDGKWEDEFDEERTRKYEFRKEDDTTEDIDMMFVSQDGGYLMNDLATGFIKPYKGGEFSYIALLPRMENEVSLDQLVASLSPESVRSLIDDQFSWIIDIGVPKYEAEYSIELSDVLKQLGVTDAFDEVKADLSRMIENFGYNVYVSKVNHKTYISMDEKGTKAAAVTEVETGWKSLPLSVRLDRPFVYMIVDSNGLPIFIGTFEG